MYAALLALLGYFRRLDRACCMSLSGVSVLIGSMLFRFRCLLFVCCLGGVEAHPGVANENISRMSHTRRPVS